MPNVNKQSYAFTALTPIISGRSEGIVHVAELRGVLARLNNVSEGPFARLNGTHFGRWCVVDNVPQFAFPTHADNLESKYLMLEADFDGDRDSWIDSLHATSADLLRDIYSHCVGFPGLASATVFRDYLVRCQLNTTLDFSPFSEYPLPTVLRAIESQRRFVGFARAVQGRSNIELKAAFAEFVRQREAAPPPRPGSI